MTAIVACPECQGKLRIPETSIGKRIRCPKCQAVFPIEDRGNKLDSPSATAGVQPGAPNIGRRSPVSPIVETGMDDAHPRRRPSGSTDAMNADGDVRSHAPRSYREDDEEDYDRAPRRRSRKKKPAGSNAVLLWCLIGGGVVVLAGGVVALVLILNTDKDKDDPNKIKEKQVGANQKKPDAWEPEQVLLSQLNPEISISRCKIRIPKDYKFKESTAPEGGKLNVWTGPPRVDGTNPVILLGVFPIPPAERANATVENQGRQMLTGFFQSMRNVDRSAEENGLINGLRFLRVRWTGIGSTGKRVKGLIHVGIDVDNMIMLGSQDVETYHIQTGKLIESSTVTFRK